jgi:hypothetical protein
VARELERAVVALVTEASGAEQVEQPPWLVRPGRTECGELWPLVMEIYADLTGGMVLPEIMRPVERRQVDAVLQRSGEPPRILEVDERQHFNVYRARTLRFYAHEIPLAFPAAVWIERSIAKARLEGGGFGRPKPPLFPGEGGRHRQRAFRDALCDLLPPAHGFLPTLRIADFEVADWVFSADAPDRMSELLALRTPGVAAALPPEEVARLPKPSAPPSRARRARSPASESGRGGVSSYIQAELVRRDLMEVDAVTAAAWLDAAGILRDSPTRPGLPLRRLLRRGEIACADQRPPVKNGRWFIVRE